MRLLFFLLWLTIFSHCDVMAHQASVTYVANEAVLITNGDKKVLFDPFFSSSFWYLSVSATGDPAGHI
jgi:hypothetical protein